MKRALKPVGRQAVKAWNHQKIIDATIEVITRYGIAGTTVARVVALADVSMGLINRHFKTKDGLLHEVLVRMADEYLIHWQNYLLKAPKGAADQLSALVLADLDPEVLNLKTMGVWFAFRAQARVRPEYVDLVGTREQNQMEKMVSLFSRLNKDCDCNHNPEIVALGLIALLDGIWTDYYLYPEKFNRLKALESVCLILNGLYPGRFSMGEDES